MSTSLLVGLTSLKKIENDKRKRKTKGEKTIIMGRKRVTECFLVADMRLYTLPCQSERWTSVVGPTSLVRRYLTNISEF